MSRARRLVALAVALLAVAVGAAEAQPPAPPLTARIFFPSGTPADGVFTGQAIPITLQIENTSGAPVATTDGYSATEFFRRLYFTDPQGGIVTNKLEEQVHDVSRVFMCLTRGNVLLRQAIPVVPIEILAGGPGASPHFALEFQIPDARTFYDLSRPGTYTVEARIPLVVFTLSDPTTVFANCDQVPGQVANVGGVAGQAGFTVVSNTLSFTVDVPSPGPPVTTASVTPTPSPSPDSWLRDAAVVSFTATSPSNVPLQRIVVQTSGAVTGETNLTGSQGSITVSADGATTIAYHAEDAGGNIEEPRALSVRVDRTAPSVTITVPAPDASFPQGQVVRAAYVCADAASGVATCAGPVANDSPIDTSTTGPKTFTVTASDVAGNVTTAAVTYTVTAGGSGPDLIETAVSNPPGAAVPGGRFSVTDTVMNRGNAATTASTTRYYLSANTQKGAGDTPLAVTRAVTSLAPGATSTGTRTVTIPTTITLGSHYVLACADDAARVVEVSDANNCLASATTMLIGRPDLVTAQVSDPPAVVTPGGTFSVTDTAVNQGQAPAGPSTTRYYLSPVDHKTSASKLLTGTRTVSDLGPTASSQGTKVVTVPTTTTLAVYYLLACADDLGRVIETDETNNCAASATQVTVARPDLAVIAVSNPPATAAKGSSFTVTDTVANRGLAPAGPSTTKYYLSLNRQRDTTDKLLTGSRSVPAIGPDTSSPAPAPVTVTIPRTVASGTYFVLACADDLRRVAELDETNNCRASDTPVVIP